MQMLKTERRVHDGTVDVKTKLCAHVCVCVRASHDWNVNHSRISFWAIFFFPFSLSFSAFFDKLSFFSFHCLLRLFLHYFSSFYKCWGYIHTAKLLSEPNHETLKSYIYYIYIHRKKFGVGCAHQLCGKMTYNFLKSFRFSFKTMLKRTTQ